MTELSTSALQQIKTISSLFNYIEVLKTLENYSKKQYGNTFKFYDDDVILITKLTGYFLRDEQLCRKFNINLQKGIMLTGPIGCGKTSIMNIMKIIPELNNRYRLKSCREITFEFIKDSYSVIGRYTKGDIYRPDLITYCFDDLGTESNIKLYGNECNVMGEILLSRYELFIKHKLYTHLTTNLSAQEIDTNYGNRIRSRLRQMVNLISFDIASPDKRK